ncbi:MAG: 16S rRNA (guanine(527)-N(7))-methyltransferase RsmG [Acetobacteraceae bacterium]|nr:16S rRNA (guanine(527)-N(7))-methyltransferase RsmG [Acetobacteraceae bacterium]
MQAALSHPAALSADAETRLRTFATLLLRWTQRINLISRNDQAHVWERHVLDCVRLAPFLPPGTERAIDLGSGAGLPGLVLAIATGIPFDLVESDRRKAAFLTEAASVTQAPVKIHCARIESLALPQASVVTARALAPLPALLGLAAPLLAPGGTLLFPKGAQVWAELEAARADWRFTQRVVGSLESPILCLTDVARA